MAEYKWIKESQHLTMPMTVMHGLPLGTIDLFCRTFNGYNRQIFSCTSLKSLAVPIAIRLLHRNAVKTMLSSCGAVDAERRLSS